MAGLKEVAILLTVLIALAVILFSYSTFFILIPLSSPFFLCHTLTTEISTLSLHDALPIQTHAKAGRQPTGAGRDPPGAGRRLRAPAPARVQGLEPRPDHQRHQIGRAHV